MRKIALKILRRTFEEFVRRGTWHPLPPVLPHELTRAESGVYVAAFENPGRKPRGRVGSYLPTKSTLAEEIQAQAVRLAGAYPFRKEDVPFLEFEALLTKPPHLLADIAGLDSAAGLLVRTSTGKHGVSLPAARQRDAHKRLADVCRRAGIDAALDGIRIYEFAIDVLRETDENASHT